MLHCGQHDNATGLFRPLCTSLIAACQQGDLALQHAPTPTVFPTTDVENMVELLIYSGRPNPQVGLSEPQVQELLKMVDSLPQTLDVPPDGGLGYSGFLAHVMASQSAAATIKAFDGVVEVTVDGQISYRNDEEKLIEHWFLDIFASQIDKDMHELVLGELSKK